ncbi:4857_t:CDS:2 [Funneliformis geosporum]|uniref:3849_t:CDS:1 n=1 Tax=Funneliformis geosporum TaxID=1117311 RepID=A0A9W4WQF8_9GLOM|nr:4857_t:CDS:2 [Funneliformis geosporum]CAI2164315.1 3849_t:CDS:2 [Funneliformis geosporum]
MFTIIISIPTLLSKYPTTNPKDKLDIFAQLIRQTCQLPKCYPSLTQDVALKLQEDCSQDLMQQNIMATLNFLLFSHYKPIQELICLRNSSSKYNSYCILETLTSFEAYQEKSIVSTSSFEERKIPNPTTTVTTTLSPPTATTNTNEKSSENDDNKGSLPPTTPEDDSSFFETLPDSLICTDCNKAMISVALNYLKENPAVLMLLNVNESQQIQRASLILELKCGNSFLDVTIKKHEITWPKSPTVIEEGSLGKTYKVQYKGTDAVIRSSKDDLEAILEEFHVHYKLREHENILKFYGIIIKSDRIALIYEYTAYGKLSTFLKENSLLGWEIKSKLCHDITLALFQCHELNISNFNLKLDDIYLTGDWMAKIAGFNNDYDKRKSRKSLNSLSPDNSMHWVAPEAVSLDQDMRLSFERNPKLADIYCLGLIFWAIAMNGQIPYEENVENIIEEKRQRNANELLQNHLPKSIPPEFSNLIFKMTKFTPRQRPKLLTILCTLERLYDFDNQQESLSVTSSKGFDVESDISENLISNQLENVSQASQFYAGSMSSLMNNSDSNILIHQEYQFSQIEIDLLEKITSLYLEAEKFGYDWLIKNLKSWIEIEKMNPKTIFDLINIDLNKQYRRCIIGYFYEEGFGTFRDTKQAYKYYKKSAEEGDHYAQNHLALCYQDGIGIERDSLRAFDWFTESASGGNVSAQNNLAMCFDYGKGTGPNRVKAFTLYKTAAEGGNVLSQYSLSLCYEGGYGTSIDKKKAWKWLETAAKNGNLAAIETLKARKRKNQNWFTKGNLFSKKNVSTFIK